MSLAVFLYHVVPLLPPGIIIHFSEPMVYIFSTFCFQQHSARYFLPTSTFCSCLCPSLASMYNGWKLDYTLSVLRFFLAVYFLTRCATSCSIPLSLIITTHKYSNNIVVFSCCHLYFIHHHHHIQLFLTPFLDIRLSLCAIISCPVCFLSMLILQLSGYRPSHLG